MRIPFCIPTYNEQELWAVCSGVLLWSVFGGSGLLVQLCAGVSLSRITNSPTSPLPRAIFLSPCITFLSDVGNEESCQTHIYHLCISLGELSIQVFCSFFYQFVLLLLRFKNSLYILDMPFQRRFMNPQPLFHSFDGLTLEDFVFVTSILYFFKIFPSSVESK